MEVEKKEIELYIHIPFCVKKCNYCDFLSGPSTKSDRERYVKALTMELYSYADTLKGCKVRSIFIGGGTPSLLSEDEITQIFDVLSKITEQTNDCEITIECNPGTITRSLLATYRKLSINRLSFGLQSAHNEELKLLGRIHTYEQFLENYQLARELGFSNINIDLMSALPRQTLASYEDTLLKVLALNPEHISAYSLIIEEGTAFYNQYGEHGLHQSELPTEEIDRNMYERTKELLAAHGYHRYEISNYAKPGYECRHNAGYWTGIDYLGFGLGASSLWNHERYQNENVMETYITEVTQKKDIRRDRELLSIKDQMEEFVFLGLRMTNGISLAEFEKRFHVTFDSIYGTVLPKLVEEKVITLSNHQLALTDYGLDVSNSVFSEFIL